MSISRACFAECATGVFTEMAFDPTALGTELSTLEAPTPTALVEPDLISAANSQFPATGTSMLAV